MKIKGKFNVGIIGLGNTSSEHVKYYEKSKVKKYLFLTLKKSKNLKVKK